MNAVRQSASAQPSTVVTLLAACLSWAGAA